MLRSTPMNRGTGFKRPTIERVKTVHKPVPEHLRRAVTIGPVELVAAPKTVAKRNRALLDMAKDRTCLLDSPACPRNGDTSITVACHSNQSKHGKGERRKADDHYSVWGCFYCHNWLDQGNADQAQKAAVFEAALQRQLEQWSHLAIDMTEPERMRRAAAWALEQHKKDARA